MSLSKSQEEKIKDVYELSYFGILNREEAAKRIFEIQHQIDGENLLITLPGDSIDALLAMDDLIRKNRKENPPTIDQLHEIGKCFDSIKEKVSEPLTMCVNLVFNEVKEPATDDGETNGTPADKKDDDTGPEVSVHDGVKKKKEQPTIYTIQDLPESAQQQAAYTLHALMTGAGSCEGVIDAQNVAKAYIRLFSTPGN